jgi:hypothetical protein
MSNYQIDEPRSFVPKYTFDIAVDHETESIALKTTSTVNGIAKVMALEYMRCKEQAIRQGLVELGWTPPHQWQPVETAPKDGTSFLAGWFGRVQLVSVSTVQVIQWHEGFGCWRGDRPGPVYDWTHWMPLPTAP